MQREVLGCLGVPVPLSVLSRAVKRSAAGTVTPVPSPGRRPRAGRDYRRRQGRVRRRAPRRDGGSGQPRPDREGAVGQHRRDRAVPRRRLAAGRVFGDVHVAGLQDRQARRHPAHGHVRGHGECRSGARRARRNDHRHRSIADRGRPERQGAADDERRRHRRHPQLAERRRAPVLDSRTERVAGGRRRRRRRCRWHHRWHGRPRRDHPRREHLRLTDQDRRAEHGLHRPGHGWRAAPEYGRRVGSRDQHLRRAGRSGGRRGEPQRHPEGRRQHVQGLRLWQHGQGLDAGQ